jgi:predicted outer membrane repeat protein
MRRFFGGAGVCLCFLGAPPGGSPAAAETYRVAPDGTGDYPTIQAAISAAGDGDVIELENGTYTGAGNRDLDFDGKAITVRSEGDDPDACVIDVASTESDPHDGFLFASGEGSGSVLSGVTIRNSGGPAVTCNGSSPAIRRCILTASGGGIECDQASPEIVDCTISANRALNGAGLRCLRFSAPVVTRCRFIGNTAAARGGGVYCRASAAPRFEECIFSGNAAFDGGAVALDDGCDPAFDRCTFYRNAADAGGGAILCGLTSSPTFVHTLIMETRGAKVVECEDGFSRPIFTCSNIHGSEGGNWVDCVADQLPVDGNLQEDPQLCSESPDVDGNWSLQGDSPCAPEQSACGQIGAGGVGCDVVPIAEMTWGRVKAQFR